MAFELHRAAFPAIAASAVRPGQAVTLDSTTERGVFPCATANVRPFGVALASAAVNEAVTVHDLHSVVKMTAAASVGVGALVGVATDAPKVRPITGASGVISYAIGQTVTAASADGEVVSVYVNPKQLGGLA